MAPKIREGEEEGAIGDDRCKEWAVRRGAVVLHPVPTRSAAGGAPGTQRRLGEVSWRVTPIQAHPAAAWGLPGSGAAPVHRMCGLDFRLFVTGTKTCNLCKNNITVQCSCDNNVALNHRSKASQRCLSGRTDSRLQMLESRAKIKLLGGTQQVRQWDILEIGIKRELG